MDETRGSGPGGPKGGRERPEKVGVYQSDPSAAPKRAFSPALIAAIVLAILAVLLLLFVL